LAEAPPEVDAAALALPAGADLLPEAAAEPLAAGLAALLAGAAGLEPGTVLGVAEPPQAARTEMSINATPERANQFI